MIVILVRRLIFCSIFNFSNCYPFRNKTAIQKCKRNTLFKELIKSLCERFRSFIIVTDSLLLMENKSQSFVISTLNRLTCFVKSLFKCIFCSQHCNLHFKFDFNGQCYLFSSFFIITEAYIYIIMQNPLSHIFF